MAGNGRVLIRPSGTEPLVRVMLEGNDLAVIQPLAEELAALKKPMVLVGDGAQLCLPLFRERGLPVRLAPPHLLMQSAWGVARGALELARRGELTDAAGLVPEYHRLSQAERERLA